MKIRYLCGLLLLASLTGYLEWADQQAFVFQVEWQILEKIFSDPLSLLHPLIVAPLAGQVLLLLALFRSFPNRKLIYTGMAFIGLLYLVLLLVAVLSLNVRVFASSVPFLVLAVITLRRLRLMVPAQAI